MAVTALNGHRRRSEHLFDRFGSSANHSAPKDTIIDLDPSTAIWQP